MESAEFEQWHARFESGGVGCIRTIKSWLNCRSIYHFYTLSHFLNYWSQKYLKMVEIPNPSADF